MAAKFTLDADEAEAGLSAADAATAQQAGSSLQSITVGGYGTPLLGAALASAVGVLQGVWAWASVEDWVEAWVEALQVLLLLHELVAQGSPGAASAAPLALGGSAPSQRASQRWGSFSERSQLRCRDHSAPSRCTGRRG